MKFYYTLTCVILPAVMMAACSASGPKKSTTEETAVASTVPVAMHQQNMAENTPVVPLTEKIEANTLVTDNIPEDEKFPLTQIAQTNNNIKPVKRIYQFGFDKQEIDPAEKISLEEHANYLMANPDTVLIINGHSDTQGNQIYNKFLSKQRAEKVARFLIEYGVAANQIKVNGLGDSQPLNDVNNFKENRRVELEYSDSRVASK